MHVVLRRNLRRGFLLELWKIKKIARSRNVGVYTLVGFEGVIRLVIAIGLSHWVSLLLPSQFQPWGEKRKKQRKSRISPATSTTRIHMIGYSGLDFKSGTSGGRPELRGVEHITLSETL